MESIRNGKHFIKKITKKPGIEESQVTNKKNFEAGLDADFVEIVELVMALKDKFINEIPDQDAEMINTVKNTIDYALNHKKA